MPQDYFIHVGFFKSASTWLQERLNKHPEADFLVKSSFFQPLGKEDYKKGSNFYFEKLKSLNKEAKIIGESDEHLVAPVKDEELKMSLATIKNAELVAQRIKETLGKSKIIIVIRNQEKLLLSLYCEYIRGGNTMKESAFFELMLSQYQKHLDLRYSQYYDIYCREFGKENVLLVLQEEIARDSVKEFKKICTFLNIDPQYVPQGITKRARKSTSYIGLKTLLALNKIIPIFNINPKTLIGKIIILIRRALIYFIFKLDAIIFYRLSKLLNKNKADLIKPFKEKIKETYSVDNGILSNKIKVKLTDYGYE